MGLPGSIHFFMLAKLLLLYLTICKCMDSSEIIAKTPEESLYARPINGGNFVRLTANMHGRENEVILRAPQEMIKSGLELLLAKPKVFETEFVEVCRALRSEAGVLKVRLV